MAGDTATLARIIFRACARNLGGDPMALGIRFGSNYVNLKLGTVVVTQLLGLQWGDLTDEGLEITRALVLVAGVPTFSEPKTPRSRRLVPIPAETSAALKEHGSRQLRERLLLGPDYTDADLIFAEGDGSPINPERLSDAFCRLAKAAGLPRIRLHDLRHSWATAALRAGVPVKVVSEILGHSSTTITADVYQHTTPTMLEGASGTVAALIFGR